MDVFWLEAQPWNPATSAAETVRICNVDLSALVLFEGNEWLPVMDGGPIFSTQVFDGSFTGRAQSTRGQITMVVGAGEIDAWAGYAWAGRSVKIWKGTIDTKDPQNPVFPTTRVLISDCIAESFDPDEGLLHLTATLPHGKIATDTYAGTGGLEGVAGLEKVVKPFAAGQHRNRKGVLLDPGKVLFQLHGYGAIQALTRVRERGIILDQGFVHHTSFQSLFDAVVPATEIHVHLPTATFRLGFTPMGDVTADFQGDTLGGTYSGRVGKIIQRLLTKAGWALAKIDTASLDYIDTQLPHDIQFYDGTGLELEGVLSEILATSGGYWDVDDVGVFYAGLFKQEAAADFSIGEDGVGDYDILEIDHLPVRPPFWRTRMGYEFNPVVMDYGDTERGATQAQLDEIQRIQDLTDGTVTIYFASAAPATAAERDLWQDTDDGIWYKRTNGAWVATAGLGALGEALAAAAGAQSTADGKITSIYSDATPTGASLGDLWTRPSDTPKVVKRWDGAAWTTVSTVGAKTGENLVNNVGAVLTQPQVVTSEGTASAITNQGGLATKNAVDLATADVVNKSLANVDPTASGKLGGIAEGAGTTITLTPYGGATTAGNLQGNTLIKPGSAANGHDSWVAALPLAGSAVASMRHISGAYTIVGFDHTQSNGDPASQAWRLEVSGSGTWYLFKDGTSFLSGSNAQLGNGRTITLVYDGAYVLGYSDELRLFKTAATAGQIYYPKYWAWGSDSKFVDIYASAIGPRPVIGSTLELAAGTIPTEGALVTAQGTASAIASQGTLATRSNAQFGTATLVDGAGATATDANYKTSQGTASAILNQGSLATLNSVAYGSAQVTGFAALAAKSYIQFATEQTAAPDIYLANGTRATDVKVHTPEGTAAAIASQSAWATSTIPTARLNNITNVGRAGAGFVSSGDARPFGKVVATGDAANGVAVSFGQTFSSIPKVSMLPGGKGPQAGANIAIRAEALTASGFTMKATEQTVTPGATITETGVAANVDGFDFAIDKASAGDPYDGKFTLTFSVSVPEIAAGEPGNLEVSVFVKKGGVWTEVGSNSYSTTGQKTITVSPGIVAQQAGYEFAIDAGGFVTSGAAITAFSNVKYTLGTVTESALTTLSNIPFIAFLEQ